MNSSRNAIEVEDVKKSFKVYYDRGTTIKEKMLTHGRSRFEVREVLRGISLEVKRGEAIGLIGKNGCGKSTTLKLLSRIIYPNEGTVRMEGRVSSLLELGAGFHPDMSGRENIYMNAAVFGLNRKEIDARAAEIIRFSELQDYIDNPVRTYSSGMYMRLAFSVAINVDADILLIDEILAVGDVSFQKKCYEKLEDIKKGGSTIVIVSHSLDQIEKICSRTVWLEDGLIKQIGKPNQVHKQYLAEMEKNRLERFEKEYYEDLELETEKGDTVEALSMPQEEPVTEEVGIAAMENCAYVEEAGAAAAQEGPGPAEENEATKLDQELFREPDIEEETVRDKIRLLKKNFLNMGNRNIDRRGRGIAAYTGVFITDAEDKETVIFETGEEIRVYLEYASKKDKLLGNFCILFYREDGLYCYGTNAFIERQKLCELKREGALEIRFQDVPLLPGKYYICVCIHDDQAQEYDFIENAATIQMYSGKGEQGVVRINSIWETE